MKKTIKQIRKDGKIQYEIDGKIYENYDELPIFYKNLLKDEDKDGIPDNFEGSEEKKIVIVEHDLYHKKYDNLDEVPDRVKSLFYDKNKKIEQTYVINGKKYHSFDELPEKYKIILSDKNKNGIPDRFEEFIDDNSGNISTQSKFVITEDKEDSSGKYSGVDYKENNSNDSCHENERYCSYCGSELPKKSIFGFIKCKSCGKRFKI